MQEKENILRILEETIKALKKEDSVQLNSLSNQTIHTASITQDPDNVAVAVIIYSLSKVIERPVYRVQKGWDKLYKNIIIGFEQSIWALKNQDDEHLRDHLKDLRKRLEGFSGGLKKYIQDVFRKASINKASKIYDHGISMEKTSKLLGITMWELATYAGQIQLDDYDLGRTMNTRQRIKLAMEMFE
jgi:hypothetical protein